METTRRKFRRALAGISKKRRFKRRRRFIRRRLPPELKSFDQWIPAQDSRVITSFVLPLINNATYKAPSQFFEGITLLNGIGEGTQYYGRVGARVMMTSLWFRALLTNNRPVPPPASAQSTAIEPLTMTTFYTRTVRILLVYDRQPNGVPPLIGEIFSINNSPPSTFSGVNIRYRQRFKLVAERIYNVRLSFDRIMVNIFKKISLPVTYSGTTAGTIGNLTTGALYLVAFDNQGAVYFTDASGIDGYHVGSRMTDMICRIRYVDS